MDVVGEKTKLDLAEEAIRETEEMFRVLSEQSFMAICLVQDDRIKYVNQTFLEFVKSPREEVLTWTRKDYLKYIHPDDRKFVVDQGRKKQIGDNEGIVPHYFFRWLTSSGETRWIDVFSKTISYKGEPADFITFTDITDSKRMAEALRESEGRLRQILENIRDVVFTLSPEGTISSVSPEFERITGWTRTEWIGRPFVEILLPEDIPIAIKGFEATIMGESPPPYEGSIIAKSGEILTFEVKGTPQIKDGQIIGYLGIARDVTERKNMENLLLEGEKTFRDLISNLTDIVAESDSEGNFTFVSPQVYDLLGYQPEEFISKNGFDLIHPDDRKSALDITKRALSGEQIFSFEYRIRHKDGHYIPVTGSGRMTEYEDNIKLVFVIRDITKRKKMELALRESEERRRSFMDAATDSFALWDSELNLVDVNKSGLKTFLKGTSKEKIIGNNILDFAGKLANVEVFMDVLKTGKPFVGDRPTPHSIFGDLFLSVKAFKVGDGLGIITTDITERKKMEIELRENEEKFRSIFEKAPIGMALTDMHFRFSKINMVFCQMMGYSEQELSRLSFPDITHPDYHKKDIEYTKKLVREEISTYQTEHRYLKKNGKQFWCRTTFSLLNNDKGTPIHYLAMIEDITALKLKEEEIKNQILKYTVKNGNTYLIKETFPALSQSVFENLIKVGYMGFIISRTPKREYKEYRKQNVDFFWLTEENNNEKIHKFIENAPDKSVFLIDRLEYLFSKEGSEKGIRLVYKLSEIAYLKDLIILLSVDSSTLTDREIRILEKETKSIEPRFMAKVSEEFLEILRLIYHQNNQGIKPSYSNIGDELQISRPTVRKRVKRLVSTGYLIEHQFGNSKVLEVTEKGRFLFLL